MDCSCEGSTISFPSGRVGRCMKGAATHADINAAQSPDDGAHTGTSLHGALRLGTLGSQP